MLRKSQRRKALKAQKKKLGLRLIKTYLAPHLPLFMLAMLCMIIAALTTAGFAQLMQPVFDDVLINRKEDMILPIATAVFLCITLRGLSTYGHIVLMSNIGQDIIATLQRQLFKRFIKADLAFHHTHPSGSLITYMISDTAVMRGAVSEGVAGIGKSFVTLVFLVALMFYQNWKLSLFSFIIFPPAALSVAYIGRKIRSVSRNTQEKLSLLTNKLTQVFQAIRQVKISNQEESEQRRMDGYIEYVRKLYKKSVRVGNLSTPINDILVGLILFAIIAYGGFSVLGGDMTVGELVSFITAFLLAYEPMKKLSKLNVYYNSGLAAAERVFDVLDMPSRIKDRAGAKNLKIKKPSVSFDNVSFAYDDDQRKAIQNLDLDIEANTTVALVGPSGGGKSTILSLISRFYDPQEGRILIDKQDIARVKQKSLRDSIAYVPQDVVIFDEDVAFNIAYGMPKVTQKQIEAAAKAAFAHDFIKDMPQGYQTRLGEHGTKLSGGQKQRIAIARAILKNAPILLLDEATSALDNESEQYIQKSFDKMRKKRTCIVIAHRLSTIQNADKIIVIDKGQVIEQGTHAQLLKKNGLYKQLHQATLKG